MSEPQDKSRDAAAETRKAQSDAIRRGSPEEKVRAWLQVTRDESGHSKAGDWMGSLIPHLDLVSVNAEGPHPSCVFSYTVQPDNCNRLQNLHGGCAATLFDWCTTLPLALVNRPDFWLGMGVSRTLNVTYMRPVPAGEEVLLECEIIQVGKKLATLRGTMRRRRDNMLLAVCEHGKVNIDADLKAKILITPSPTSHSPLLVPLVSMEDTAQEPPREPVLLTALPAEILHHILQWLAPADLISLPRVCSALHVFVKSNRKLYRDVYLNTLDAPKDGDLDWDKEIQDLVRLEVICNRQDAAHKKPELGFVHSTVTRLLHNASSSGEAANFSRTHSVSRNAALLQSLFRERTTSEAFLQGSSLFERLRSDLRQQARTGSQSTDPACKALHRKSAHLHCLYGSPILNVGRLRSTRTYPFACSKVYDLREYTRLTRWGPFLDDGSDRVDWEKVEAILIVLGTNIGSRRLVARIFGEIWDSPFSGSWPDSYMAPPQRDISSLEARDPYGVTGTWYRIVCFLDYNDFFSYNFPEHDFVSPGAPRPALDVGEATRLIMLRIHVTEILPAGPDDGQDLPVVHFRGVSRSLDDSFDDNANSNIQGTVRLTREGEVRWTTFSIFHGAERWRSEGIQIGGVRSARGVVGNWFDRDYDAHGPVGPTAFWKGATPDQMATMEDDLLPSDFFLPYGALIDIDSETDPEAEMDYIADDDDEEEEEDEEMAGVMAGELPGLLLDASLGLNAGASIPDAESPNLAHGDQH
ncbi:hypothetical protein FZEAL_8038 [Fusarium zealandicum]|uniref:F-box domain-containing protein n=1 Tax=Fusarium zealandicum TaxID=1053134 RepID=A0A8H4UEM2_9HYPO|nr:hypothetical protein FZEAL_8038 [Fusarium zealandicum]